MHFVSSFWSRFKIVSITVPCELNCVLNMSPQNSLKSEGSAMWYILCNVYNACLITQENANKRILFGPRTCRAWTFTWRGKQFMYITWWSLPLLFGTKPTCCLILLCHKKIKQEWHLFCAVYVVHKFLGGFNFFVYS